MKNKNKDLEDWIEFIKNPGHLQDKDKTETTSQKKKIFVFDLHGYTLEGANTKVKKIILDCYQKNYKNILLVTGKGLHSNRQDNVFSSKDFNKLKNTVPDFIKNNEDVSSIIKSIKTASKEMGGEGALYITLKSKV